MVALEAWFDINSDDPTIVRTPDELDAVLDQITAWGGSHIVELLLTDDPGYAIFDVGLDGKRERGTLYYSARNRDTWFSLGAAPNEPTPLYYYMSSDTEYPPGAELPLAEVRRAAHEFMETGGRRPTGVQWQPRPE